MNKLIILITISVVFLILLIILHIHYRKVIKKKNVDVFHYIKEQNRLSNELSRSKIEKEMLEKILNDKIVIKLEINE